MEIDVFDKYKIFLGKELAKYLNGTISFSEFENNISPLATEDMRNDEVIRDVWHIIYQYDNDILTGDSNYVARIKKRIDRKSTRLNSSHTDISRMPSSA